MNEANLTRFGPATIRGGDQAEPASFRGIEGAATLALQYQGAEALNVTINGAAVAEGLSGTGETMVSITLAQNNNIDVSLAAGTVEVRVRQVTSANLGLLRQGYFGLNTTDLEKQRAFYRTMGFIGEIYPAGPERSTSFARSLGFEDNYLIHVSLHSLENPPTPPFVDTVQFREESYREEPPYPNLNHLGMAYATYSTPDLDGDVAYLEAQGVTFLSAPATAPDGERFAFLKEQDGAFLKLIEADGEVGDSRPNLQRLVNTNMNVADLERSREFYRLIGFSEATDRSQAGGGEFAAAHGFDQPIEFDGLDISLGEGTDGATLQLRQWRTPYDGAPPYPPPVNHLGIDRINFYVENLTETIRQMNELGFEQLGPIGGSPEIGIVFFFDPDGIKVQFAGPQSS